MPNRSNYDLVIVLNKALTGGDSASSGFFIQDFYIVVNNSRVEIQEKTDKFVREACAQYKIIKEKTLNFISEEIKKLICLCSPDSGIAAHKQMSYV